MSLIEREREKNSALTLREGLGEGDELHSNDTTKGKLTESAGFGERVHLAEKWTKEIPQKHF